MARKQRKKKAQGVQRPSSQPARNGRKSKPLGWRKLVRRLQIALAILAIPTLVVGLEIRDNIQRSDLSVIGTGTPVVVQAHDPKCPQCRSLLDNAEAAHADFRDDIAFRVVNLRSGDGRAFAREFGVGKVTLVVFNGAGEVEHILRGVRPVEHLRHLFADLAGERTGS